MSAPIELIARGRVTVINGNVLRVHTADLGAFRPGMRLVVDDDRYGRTPNAGFATIESIDEADSAIAVDSLAAFYPSVGDYLFERPLDAAELLELRVVELERITAPPRYARERFDGLMSVAALREVMGDGPPHTAAGRLQAIAEVMKPGDEDEPPFRYGPDAPGRSASQEFVSAMCEAAGVPSPPTPSPAKSYLSLLAAIRASLQAAVSDPRTVDAATVCALTDALRAVEGR